MRWWYTEIVFVKWYGLFGYGPVSCVCVSVCICVCVCVCLCVCVCVCVCWQYCTGDAAPRVVNMHGVRVVLHVQGGRVVYMYEEGGWCTCTRREGGVHVRGGRVVYMYEEGVFFLPSLRTISLQPLISSSIPNKARLLSPILPFLTSHAYMLLLGYQ